MVRHGVLIRDGVGTVRGAMWTRPAFRPADGFKPCPRRGFIRESVNEFDKADSVSIMFSRGFLRHVRHSFFGRSLLSSNVPKIGVVVKSFSIR